MQLCAFAGKVDGPVDLVTPALVGTGYVQLNTGKRSGSPDVYFTSIIDRSGYATAKYPALYRTPYRPAIEKHCTPRSAINNAFRFFTPKWPRTSGPKTRKHPLLRTLVDDLQSHAVSTEPDNVPMHRTFAGSTATEPPIREPRRMSDSRGRRAAKSQLNCFVHVLRTVNEGRIMQTSILPRDRP